MAGKSNEMCVRRVDNIRYCDGRSDDRSADYFCVKQLLVKATCFFAKKIAADVVCLIITRFINFYRSQPPYIENPSDTTNSRLIQFSIQISSSIQYDINCVAVHNTPHIIDMLRHVSLLSCKPQNTT
jgi:hypothetical protein